MFDLRNQSPFIARLLPSLEPDGAEAVLAIVKGTFEIGAREDLALAEPQVPLTLADQYYGEPGKSSIRYASDIVPEKRGTDVVLVGAAHVARGEAVAVEVTLEAGPLRKRIAVIGDRRWQRSSARGVHASSPRPFSVMPLVYERAFGGQDHTSARRNEWADEPRNPVGCGLVANPARRDLAEVPLPNLEDPADPIADPTRRPIPTGLGFIAPSWKPRIDFAGTHDEAWRKDRFPLPPRDFDVRFYNSAPSDLVSPRYFAGGEPVTITNASRHGTLRFRVPAFQVDAVFFVDGQKIERPCNLDTVVIEPDQKRLMLTWRASARCHRKMKFVSGARITSRVRGG